jgi:MoaA/NifB/PqqE/SkfB family radical SAM enzyme
MILEGPLEISISLNSHKASLHDQTRGVPGAFQKATNALRQLLDARRRLSNQTTRIYAMGLIFNENYREIEDFYDFVLNDIGADKLKLNFLQPSFGDTQVDHFFAEHHDVDPAELAAILQRCNERFRLGLNPKWLSDVQMYFDSLRDASHLEKGWAGPTRTARHICNTYERNIMVDHYGMARLCFSTDFRGVSLRVEGDLQRFWLDANDIRRRMRSCNRLCGISHSVRRNSSTMAPAGYSIAQK